MYLFDGKRLNIHQDITVGSGAEAITYPAGSLQNAGLRAELGIITEPDPVRPDDRLFIVKEHDDGSFSTQPRPRDQVTAQVWELIKSKREQVKAGGVKVGNKWFHTDDASRIQQIGLAMMGAAIPANLQWKTMDGSFTIMTQTLAGQVFQAVADLDMRAFASAEAHREAMLAAENPFEYDFSAGWPISFSTEQQQNP